MEVDLGDRLHTEMTHPVPDLHDTHNTGDNNGADIKCQFPEHVSQALCLNFLHEH